MSQEHDAVITWIKAGALPLTTLDPRAPLDDLAAFEQIVGDAAIVGLGEGSHGAHECFLVKHRLLRFLVEQMGFTLVAMEMDWMRAAALNDYILTGVGDVSRLLKQNGYWFWHTEELLDIIEWLRAYNVDPRHQQVAFAGFDAIGLEETSVTQVVRYIERVDPSRSAQVAALYQPLAGVSIRRLPAPAVRQWLIEAAQQVSQLLAEQAPVYIARSSPAAFAEVVRQARIVEYVTHRLYDADAPRHSAAFRAMAQRREQGLAEQVIWLHEQTSAGAKMVLWAHNWHVGTWGVWHLGPEKDLAPFQWMGIELRQRYRKQYLALGFSFGEGMHNALAIDEEGKLLIHPRPPFLIAPKRAGSYEQVLARAGRQYVLDLRAAPVGEVREWLEGPHPFRVLNDVHHSEEDNYHQAPLSRWFDVLLYLEQISPSHLLPKGLPSRSVE